MIQLLPGNASEVGEDAKLERRLWICSSCKLFDPTKWIVTEPVLHVVNPIMRSPLLEVLPTLPKHDLSALLNARRDTRMLVVELRRPTIILPPQLLLPSPSDEPGRSDEPAEPALTEAQQIVQEMLQDRHISQLLDELPELAALAERLRACTAEEAAAIVTGWRALKCVNASFVEYIRVMTAALSGANTAPYFIGGGESAKAAMFYMIKCTCTQAEPSRGSLMISLDLTHAVVLSRCRQM